MFGFACSLKEEALLELGKGIGFTEDGDGSMEGYPMGICEPLDDMHIVLFTYGQVRRQRFSSSFMMAFEKK